MKKILLILILGITLIGTESALAQKRQATAEEIELFNKRNPFLALSADVMFRDTIPPDSLIYFAKAVQMDRPKYERTVLAVVSATDDIREYIYRLVALDSTKSAFVRIKLPIENMVYTVSRLFCVSFGPGEEHYEIACNVGGGSYGYKYYLSDGRVEEIKHE